LAAKKLKSIGLDQLIIVDITNFIQHETGQPLHAFDADEIKVKDSGENLPEGTKFVAG
jgi:phenylalanyl-tRNA synthetase beta chain